MFEKAVEREKNLRGWGNHNNLVNPGRPCRKLCQAWKHGARVSEALRDQSVFLVGKPVEATMIWG